MRSPALFLLTLILTTLSSAGNAQQATRLPAAIDSLLAEVPAWPSWRVRVAGEVLLLDSVWNDSLWQWSAPCDGPLVTLRFEANGLYREKVMPCVQPPQSDSLVAPEMAHSSERNGPILLDSPMVPSYAIALELHRSQLDSLPFFSLLGRCFPMISEGAFQHWFDAVNALTFESDKCRALESRQHQTCLTTDQVVQLLQLIPSEDRRLRVLKGLAPHIDRIQQLPLEDLFHLQVFREKAGELTR
ncbi:MAG: DUF4476 domain-containing protein [Bacteroidetes bacterium]|nr:DUF4476 domain-containing protein [Bacteroidota bacterium]